MPKSRKLGSVENILFEDSHRAVYDQISYLKKRIHLVEGERKATYEFNEQSLKENEICVKKLRETNGALKGRIKQLANTKYNYFKEIWEHSGNKLKAYAYKDKDFNETVDMLECKVGDFKNRLNLGKFKRAQLEPKLKRLEQMEKLLERDMAQPRKEKISDPRSESLRHGLGENFHFMF